LVPHRLHHIKRVIRVLGIVAKGSTHNYIIVGVVFRGNLWIDGVLKAHSNDVDITDALALMLLDSSHSGQVRVIILSAENLPKGMHVSTEELSAKTRKPVILLGDTIGTTYIWHNG
jgi:endonuclease V-like protein UPF0215 family